QDAQVRVGVIEHPHTETGGAVPAQVLPRPPQRLQAYRRLGVPEPPRAPGEFGRARQNAPVDQDEIVLHDLNHGVVDESRMIDGHGDLPRGTEDAAHPRAAHLPWNSRAADQGNTVLSSLFGSDRSARDAVRVLPLVARLTVADALL